MLPPHVFIYFTSLFTYFLCCDRSSVFLFAHNTLPILKWPQCCIIYSRFFSQFLKAVYNRITLSLSNMVALLITVTVQRLWRLKICKMNKACYFFTTQLYCILRVLPCLIKDAHSSLSTALCRHLLTFVSRRSFLTYFTHLIPGLPFLLLPPVFL